MNAAIIPQIVEQHAEEAAFLWLLRRNAVRAPHYRLKDIIKLDNRVEAHIDGLRIAGNAGWQLCAEALQFEEAGEFFAAGLLALESRDPAKLEHVVSAVERVPDSAEGLISAMGWVEPQHLAGTVRELLASTSTFRQRIGLSACAVHRVNPGSQLDEWVRSPDIPSGVKIRALRTAGEIKRRDLIFDVRANLAHDSAECRFWAAWSAVLLGDRGKALEFLQTIIILGSPLGRRGLPILLRSQPLEVSHAWLKGLAQAPNRQRDLVVGAGMVGDPSYLPWLIKQMANPPLARVAGEAFSMITGADIAYLDLEGEKPEGFESGPNEDPRDHSVSLDPDEDLPWPDPVKVAAWWKANQGRFQPGIRFLCGAPIGETQCLKVLCDGYQRQRIAAALELALLQPATPLFEVRAPGWRQRSQLLRLSPA
jgi:uncharacterized protein (TIGR02270 family)